MECKELVLKLGQIQNNGFKHIEDVFGLTDMDICYRFDGDESPDAKTIVIDIDKISDKYKDVFSKSLSFPFEYEIVKQWIQIGLDENTCLFDKGSAHMDSVVKGLTIGHLDNHTLYQGHKNHSEFLRNMIRYEIHNSETLTHPETLLSKVRKTRDDGLKRAVNQFYHELRDGVYHKRN